MGCLSLADCCNVNITEYPIILTKDNKKNSNKDINNHNNIINRINNGIDLQDENEILQNNSLFITDLFQIMFLDTSNNDDLNPISKANNECVYFSVFNPAKLTITDISTLKERVNTQETKKKIENLEKIIKNIIGIVKQATGKTNDDDITIGDIIEFLNKNCLSLETNTETLLDVLKNGYIDYNDNNKRKFLNRYQVSLLLYYNKNIGKRIIDDKLSIVYNNNDPAEVILVDPKLIQDEDNSINNRQDNSLKVFLKNSKILDKNNISVGNKTPGLFQLNKILLLDKPFSPYNQKENFFFDFFLDKFNNPNDDNQKDITIINNNTVACSCMDYPINTIYHIGLPVFKCTSGYNAKNSLKILNKITKTLSNITNEDSNNEKCEQYISFVASSAGITNMIYELEKFEETHTKNDGNVYINNINIVNVPIWSPFITMSSEETADRLIAVLKKLKDKNFIKNNTKLTITLTSPDFLFVHPLCSSISFLKDLYDKCNAECNKGMLETIDINVAQHSINIFYSPLPANDSNGQKQLYNYNSLWSLNEELKKNRQKQ